MVNGRQLQNEYNTLRKDLLDLTMSYMNKKEKIQDSLASKNESKEQDLITKNDDLRKKNLRTAVDELKSRYSRPRSSSLDVGILASVEDHEVCLRTGHQRSGTLENNELQVPTYYESHPARQNNSAFNSPLAVRKFGKHLFEKRSSLPNALLPNSVPNSPRCSRQNSDFLQNKASGLNDFRKLSESLSKLEKAKARPKLYEEKPFYLCPENGSFRRNYWKLESVALEKRIEAAQKRSVSREEEKRMTQTAGDGERPLSEILPPLVLSSIYTQERNKAKRMVAEKETRKTMKPKEKNGSKERLSVDTASLTKNLSDCRYLRIPNK